MNELDEIRKEIKGVSVKIADVQREQCRIERMFTKASEQKPAHKWEAGQWAYWDCGNENSTDFKVRSTTEPCLWSGNAFYDKKYCTPIPAPAFEIGRTVAKKENGNIFDITSRRWGNGAKQWLYDEHYELELTAQLPKFKIGDEVVHSINSQYNGTIIKIYDDNDGIGWTYDTTGDTRALESYLILAPASGWKVGDMAVMIYVSGIKTIFEVKKIVPNEHLLVSKDGCMYRFEDCRHLVSMQVEGEKREEIKPGRWVRTPSGWEGLTVRQFNDGDWHVIEPAHGGGGLFKSSSLILINRPPEVLR